MKKKTYIASKKSVIYAKKNLMLIIKNIIIKILCHYTGKYIGAAHVFSI